MPGVYGGDDVSALVIDAGSSTFRCGWAGEDAPRCVIPTAYGWTSEAGGGDEEGERDGPGAPGTASGGSASKDDADRGGTGDAEGDVRMEGVESTDDARGTGGGAPRGNGKAGDAGRRRRFVGDMGVNVWRAGMEVENPLRDGIVASTSGYLALCEHALRQVGASASEHPLLLTEPAWNTKEGREQLTEIAFEGLGAPAFFLANSTVLSSFASGKPTSLLVDVGATHMSAVPVVDGFVLRKGMQRQPGLGGDAVSRALLHDFRHAPKGTPRAASASAAAGGEAGSGQGGGAIEPRPLYEVKSKEAVAAGAPSKAVLREDRIKNTTKSFRDYQLERLLHDAKESLVQVYDNLWDENGASARQSRSYEFPDGYNDTFGVERYRAAEVMFTPSLWTGAEGVLPTFHRPPQTLTQMVLDAVNATDVDSRPALLSNIVCVGGGTCLPGFNDRLNWELSVAAPSPKIKLHSPGNATERRHASWLGGSILASLGTFHQLWISRQEYDEHGAAIVHARCR